jgi:hypothetical protein
LDIIENGSGVFLGHEEGIRASFRVSLVKIASEPYIDQRVGVF